MGPIAHAKGWGPYISMGPIADAEGSQSRIWGSNYSGVPPGGPLPLPAKGRPFASAGAFFSLSPRNP